MNQPIQQHNKWLAKLDLHFDRQGTQTRLHNVNRVGPLSVQKAFYPEGRDCAHTYILHPPAGIVSGDELLLNIHVENQAHALITTPGANRFYKARQNSDSTDSKQKQILSLNVHTNAVLEHLPLETIVYEGADGENQIDIHVEQGGVYLGWDITCLGLPASQQLFSQGSFSQLNRLFYNGKIRYQDRVNIFPENKMTQHFAGLADYPVFGNFIIFAPEKLNQSDRDSLVEKIREVVKQTEQASLFSVTQINDIILIRFLGHQADACKQVFVSIWEHVRPICCGKPVNQPRIWYT